MVFTRRLLWHSVVYDIEHAENYVVTLSGSY